MNKISGHNFRNIPATMITINAKLSEANYGCSEIYNMLKDKWREWKETEMEKYFRPSTIFRPSHFDEYIAISNLKRRNSSYYFWQKEHWKKQSAFSHKRNDDVVSSGKEDRSDISHIQEDDRLLTDEEKKALFAKIKNGIKIMST